MERRCAGAFCQKSIGHFQVCYCRKFDRSILFAGAFHTNRPCRNDNISTLYFCLHSTTGSDTSGADPPNFYSVTRICYI